ncbi:MAG TPA: hypothetical protein VFT66_10300 [Roseiflexaceae bacterium]|jgi:hypothetical protein|nr:hypothetical protein [Roseiflexaceae bacterium]
MQWLDEMIRAPKDAGYAERALARYRLGMKGHGALCGVRILPGDEHCPVCTHLAADMYQPDEAPRIPLAGCPYAEGCRCAYRPVMTYELVNGSAHVDP